SVINLLWLYSNNMKVTYTPQTICTLEGSTMRINCTYDYPAGYTIQLEAWFYDHNEQNVYPEQGTIVYHTNISQVPSSYTNRVQFFGNKNKICDIQISNVSRQESGWYKFRFEGTDKWTQRPGVNVTITGKIRNVCLDFYLNLKTESPPHEKDLRVIVDSTLSTTNSVQKPLRRLTECQVIYHSRHLLSLLSPLIFKGLIVQTTPETIKENDTVTLSCSANCSLTNSIFSWFKNGRPLNKTSKDLQIQRVSTEDSVSYSCQAGNITSPERLLNVQCESVAEGEIINGGTQGVFRSSLYRYQLNISIFYSPTRKTETVICT
uniref:B-cell receptor CD22 n=1 Tax=Erpetoichthys calabaricus TaxID=27687 RepID=A0A8C4XCY1_ERPCA